MDSVKCDCCEDDIDIGYADLVDKHINKWQIIFDENELIFNQYKHIEEEVITITDNNNDRQKENSDNVGVKREPKQVVNQKSTTSNEEDIYIPLYKVLSNYRSGCAKHSTHVYTCKWWSCRYETYDYKLIKHHLHNEHIKTLIRRKYSRNFVELNVYQYECLQCDYETNIREYILKHVCDHNQWKCYEKECGQQFRSGVELIAHIDCHQQPGDCQLICAFDRSRREYLYGNGLCSLNNIRKYYQKRKVIDGSVANRVEYRYVCLWPKGVCAD